jgi:transcription initiation factor TFIID subunit 2
MDFGTMTQKLNSANYSTMEEVVRDAELVFSNCRLFNPPTTYPVQCADVLERAFKREWARAAEKKMTWTEKRSLQSLMTTLVKDPLYVFTSCVISLAQTIRLNYKVICLPGARGPGRPRDSTVS